MEENEKKQISDLLAAAVAAFVRYVPGGRCEETGCMVNKQETMLQRSERLC
jgi:hypothetical protein